MTHFSLLKPSSGPASPKVIRTWAQQGHSELIYTSQDCRSAGGTLCNGLLSAGLQQGPMDRALPRRLAEATLSWLLLSHLSPPATGHSSSSNAENSSLSACGHTQCLKEKASRVCTKEEKLEGRGRNLPPCGKEEIQLSWDQGDDGIKDLWCGSLYYKSWF